jgi:hypothetical protein
VSLIADARAELLRRILLGFVTALIVARPLVLGEDPGLLDPLSSATGLVLSLLWFVAAVGWAVWRAWSRQGSGESKRLEGGLALVAVLVFVSALGVARYRHPAVLIACEWVILVLAFGLVRELVQSAAESRGLLAALVASAVSLSAYAVYQYAVEMPASRTSLQDPEELRQELARRFNLHFEADDPQLATWQRRIEARNVFATFAHPNAFAGYLALLLPATVGGAWIAASAASGSPFWKRALLAGICALVVGLALWLTHSRGGILGTLLAAAALLAFPGRRLWWRYRAWVAVGAALVTVVAIGLSRTSLGAEGFSRAVRSFGLRTEYWAATWDMIRVHPWFGVGPGSFGRYYPRYMSPAAFEKIQDPHNFALELWATCGLFTLIAFLGLLGLFFWHARAVWAASRGPQDVNSQPSTLHPPLFTLHSVPWEFYAGGLVGLVLGFVLRAAEQPADEVLLEGVLSLGRSLVWFAAFLVFERIPWPPAVWRPALVAGVLALLLNLTVSGGISQPTVAQPLWVVAALAASSGQWAVGSGQQRRLSWLEAILPLPVAAGLALAYFGLVFQPVTLAERGLAEARRHYGNEERLAGWRNAVEPRLRETLSKEKDPGRKLVAIRDANLYLKAHILTPLEQAAQADPGFVLPPLELAEWYGQEAQFYADAPGLWQKAVETARRAEQLDPEGREGYLAEVRLHSLMAQQLAGQRKEEFGRAARALRAAVERDPTEARLHYQLAEMLFQADDPVQARLQAKAALDLEEHATVASRRLTDPQRKHVRTWLEASPVR